MKYDWTWMILMKHLVDGNLSKHFVVLSFATLGLAVTLWSFWTDVRHPYLSKAIYQVMNHIATYVVGTLLL